MNSTLIDYLESLRPSVDVLGQWLVTCNAKTAQKGMMKTALHSRQITHRRGLRNYRRVWEQVIVPRIDEVFMFTFVRNPWDRVVSAFYWLQQYRGLYGGCTFQEFVKRNLAVGIDVDAHFRPQSPTFMCQGRLIPNMFVGRFERLHEDWEVVAKKLGVQRELPHFNQSRHKPYAECYDDECRNIVAKLYAAEIEALGYKFGSN